MNVVEATSAAARSLRRRLAREDGQALVEYSLILLLIAIVCITVLTTLGNRVASVLQQVINGF